MTRRLLLMMTVAGAIAATGCLFDSEHPCGPHQRVGGQDLCECVEGYVPRPGGCVLCGEHEVAEGDQCLCEEGFARDAADAPCAAIPGGLGDGCSATAPCMDAEFDHCMVAEGADEGYCTSTGCGTSMDCPAGWDCPEQGAGSYCRRPPTGQGLRCTEASQCEGYEASYCEFFFLKQCLVQGCSVTADDCHEGSKCCDLSHLGLANTLCLPTQECP